MTSARSMAPTAWHRYPGTLLSIMTREAFRQFTSPLPEPTLLLDGDGTILAANPAAGELAGLSPQELEGRALADIVADAPPALDAALRRWAASSALHAGFLHWRRLDGAVRARSCEGAGLGPLDGSARILLRCRPGVDPDEPVPAASLSAQADDLRRWQALAEERQRQLVAEQAARRDAETANHAKDEFLALLSHELRTPLTAMLGWVRVLRTRSLDDAQRQRALETVERNVRLQSQLINDLLDVSRIVAGKLELDRYRVDLVPLVDQAVEALRAEITAKGLRLDVRLETDEILVVGDPMRLEQVVINLVGNALKFTPAGGRIEVHLTQAGARARITVSDTGEGIDPALLPHIFDRFRQADVGAARQHGGLGLGLALVRTLVSLHGGTVAADSSGRGQGARFTVNLPIMAVRLDPRETPVEPVQAKSRRLEGHTIVVVDDDADARELVGLVLREAGATVALAASASEAMGVLSSGPPDLLLSDLAMPREDGYTLVRRLRALERAEGRRMTPALALSAHTAAGDHERAIAAGFQTTLTKPIEPSELVEVVAKALAGRIPPGALRTRPPQRP